MARCIDLFSGCGGLSLGFQMAGVDVVAACENWHDAADVYRKNFNHDVHEIDLTDVSAASELVSRYNVDGIIGGPPCQDYSTAGKKQEGDRARLTCCFARIVHNVWPSFFVMENVARAQKSDAYKAARAIFLASGYNIAEIVLDAAYCGVPQHRKRFFCVGLLRDVPFFDELFNGVARAMCAEKPLTVRDYMGDKIDYDFYYRHPRNYHRRAVYSVDEPAATVRGTSMRGVAPSFPGHPSDAAPVHAQMHVMSLRELARVQTFPDTFIFDGKQTAIGQMLGNSVPVNLAKFVATVLKRFIDE